MLTVLLTSPHLPGRMPWTPSPCLHLLTLPRREEQAAGQAQQWGGATCWNSLVLSCCHQELKEKCGKPAALLLSKQDKTEQISMWEPPFSALEIFFFCVLAVCSYPCPVFSPVASFLPVSPFSTFRLLHWWKYCGIGWCMWLSWFVLPKVSPSFYQSIMDISALTHQCRPVQTVSNSTTGTHTQIVPRKYEY